MYLQQTATTIQSKLELPLTTVKTDIQLVMIYDHVDVYDHIDVYDEHAYDDEHAYVTMMI